MMTISARAAGSPQLRAQLRRENFSQTGLRRFGMADGLTAFVALDAKLAAGEKSLAKAPTPKPKAKPAPARRSATEQALLRELDRLKGLLGGESSAPAAAPPEKRKRRSHKAAQLAEFRERLKESGFKR